MSYFWWHSSRSAAINYIQNTSDTLYYSRVRVARTDRHAAPVQGLSFVNMQ